MKNWPWRKIVAGVAWSLVLFGLAPMAHLFWWGITHSPRPVSMTFPLKRGEYSSPFFKTESNEFYRIDIVWDDSKADWKALDLDWRLVDDNGALLERGAYKYRLRGNIARLGQYGPTRRLRQKIIVKNLHHAEGLD